MMVVFITTAHYILLPCRRQHLQRRQEGGRGVRRLASVKYQINCAAPLRRASGAPRPPRRAVLLPRLLQTPTGAPSCVRHPTTARSQKRGLRERAGFLQELLARRAASRVQDGGAAWYEMPRGGRVGWVGLHGSVHGLRPSTGGGRGPWRRAAHPLSGRRRGERGRVGPPVRSRGSKPKPSTLNPPPIQAHVVCTSSLPVQLTN